MPQFDHTYFISQVFWLFLCLCVLALVIRVSVTPRIRANMRKRARHLQDARDKELVHLAHIEDLTKRMNSLKEEYRQKRVDCMDSAQIRMSQEREETIARLQQKWHTHHAAFEKELELEVQSFKDNLPHLAKDLAARVLSSMTAS